MNNSWAASSRNVVRKRSYVSTCSLRKYMPSRTGKRRSKPA